MITPAQMNAMSLPEMLVLNKSLVAAIRAKQKAVHVTAACKLYVGQQVKWMSKTGVSKTGIVTKVKIKMVEVNAGPAGLWNVAASLLKSVA